MKKLIALSLIVIPALANAQMVGSDAYIQGTYMELGIRGTGGFEGVDMTVSPTPAGMHPRASSSSLFGILGNPQKNGWSGSAYDGDFFTPGSPENGWGFEIGDSGSEAAGTIAGNNCSALNQISGVITSWSHVGSYYSVDWEGNASTGADLHFKINYLMHDTALFYTTNISVTNTSLSTIPKFYFYKNFDPDNNLDLGGGFATENTVVRQPDSVYSLAHVSATQYIPWKSYIALIGIGDDWRASHGGFSNRDASSLWNGTPYFVQTPGVVDTMDEGIALSYRLLNFLPGATETFSFQTVIDTSSINAAINGYLFLDFAGEDNNSSLIPDTIKVCGADSVDISISGIAVNDYTWTWSPSAGLSDSVGLYTSAYPSAPTTYMVIGTPLGFGIPPDTMFIVVETYPLFSLNPVVSSFGDVCSSLPAFVLTGGTPSGGTYSGAGVTGTDLFDPATAPGGLQLITYTVSDYTGCSASDTSLINVNIVNASLPNNLGTYCDYLAPFTLTAGSPFGGIYSGTGITSDSVFNPAFLAGNYTITYTITDSFGCIAVDSSTISVTPCTGIESNEVNSNVFIYPNPFSDHLNISISIEIQLENAEFILYDVLGKTIMQTAIQEHEFTLGKNNIENGIYFYRIKNKNTLLSSGKLLVN